MLIYVSWFNSIQLKSNARKSSPDSTLYWSFWLPFIFYFFKSGTYFYQHHHILSPHDRRAKASLENMIYYIIMLFVITQITFHTFRKKKTTWNWHLSLSAFLFFPFALWFFTAVFWSVPDQSDVFSSFQRTTERPRMNTGFQINFFKSYMTFSLQIFPALWSDPTATKSDKYRKFPEYHQVLSAARQLLLSSGCF